MGANDENKKDTVEETNKTNNTEVKPTRYTLMVENVFAVDENESIAAVGELHGTLNKGDKFYIIHPAYPNGIEASADTLVVNGETPETASDCRVAVKITQITDPSEIKKFSVITNVAPQVRTDPSKPLENPFIVGLSCEYPKFVKDSEFTYIFMVALLTSRYMTPAQMQLEAPNGEGKAIIKDKRISFKLLRHPQNKEQLVLPLFTDMASMRLGNGLLDSKPGEEPTKTLLLPFERCAEIGLKNSGIVINPFGPAPVFVSNVNIRNTLEVGRQAMEKHKQLEENKK